MPGKLKMPVDMLIYKPLPVHSPIVEVEAVLSANDERVLCVLPLAIEQHFADWQYAQSICLQLVARDNALQKIDNLLLRP